MNLNEHVLRTVWRMMSFSLSYKPLRR